MDRQRAKRICEAMKSAGYTRDSLALSTGYSTGTISKIKSGGEIKSDQLIAICTILGVTPNYVLGFNSHCVIAEQLAYRITSAERKDLAQIFHTILDKTPSR